MANGLQPLDILTPLQQGLSIRGQREQQERARGLAPLQQQQAQLALDTGALNLETGQEQLAGAREQARLKSLVTGSLQLQQTPDEQKLGFLQQRRQQLIDQGLPTMDTDEAIELAQAGDFETLNQIADSGIVVGERLGLLQRPDMAMRGDGTTAKLTEFDRWASMEPGPERDALANILGIRKQGKNTNIPTPTGYTVVDDAGNVVNTVEIPAKKQQFEAQQKQKEQALKAAERAEAERARKAEIEKLDYEDALEQTTNQSIRAFKLAGELLKPGFIDAATGTWDRLTPTLFKSTQDAINKGLELKNMLTLENLGLMSGVLTDKDIEVLTSAGSGLRVDEDGFIGSEKAIRAQIKMIQDQLEMRLRRAVKRGDLSQEDFDSIVNPPEGRTEIVMDDTGQPVTGATGQPQVSPFSPAGQAQQSMQEGRTATNPQTGEKMIFRNGQWVPVGG